MTPFLGQIITVAFSFEPPGFAFCDGRTMPISENTALFSLLGTRYGGDGVHTFNLPHYPATLYPPNAPAHFYYLIAIEGIFPSRQ